MSSLYDCFPHYADGSARRRVRGRRPLIPGLVHLALQAHVGDVERRGEQLALAAAGLGEDLLDLGERLGGLDLHRGLHVVADHAGEIDRAAMLHGAVPAGRAHVSGDHLSGSPDGWSGFAATTEAPRAGPVKCRSARSRQATHARRRAGRPPPALRPATPAASRSEEHTSELQSLMRISYAVFCFNKKKITNNTRLHTHCTHL